MTKPRQFQPVKFKGDELTVRDLIDFNNATHLDFTAAIALVTDMGDRPTTDAIKTMAAIYWLLARRADDTLTYDECLGLTVGELGGLVAHEEASQTIPDPTPG